MKTPQRKKTFDLVATAIEQIRNQEPPYKPHIIICPGRIQGKSWANRMWAIQAALAGYKVHTPTTQKEVKK